MNKKQKQILNAYGNSLKLIQEAKRNCDKINSMNMNKPCVLCEGSGYYGGFKTECPICNGTGIISEQTNRMNIDVLKVINKLKAELKFHNTLKQAEKDRKKRIGEGLKTEETWAYEQDYINQLGKAITILELNQNQKQKPQKKDLKQ